MASSCDTCTRYSQSGLQLVEGLRQKKVSKSQKSFLNALKNKELTIDLGAGCKEILTFDEANKKYLSRYFPNLAKTVYCCPPVVEYEYPEEPSDIIMVGAEDGSHATSVNLGYDTLGRKRKGQLAEEVVIMNFVTMLRIYGIPSFIIHGYQWKAKYIKNLANLSASFHKLLPTCGEIDLLISIPEKCIIVMEVKAVSDCRNITGVVSKAFSQCGKAFDFLSMIISDIYDGRQVPVIKIAALPNCDGVSAKGLYCQSCVTHIVTKDDLQNIEALHNWFTQLLKQCSSELETSQYDFVVHEGMIGRLISPASLMQVKTIPDSIQRTVSQFTSTHHDKQSDQTISRWHQLNPVQLSVILRKNQQLLWITGEPGSGKTVLGLFKADEIVNDGCADPLSGQAMERESGKEGNAKECILYVINGFSPVFAPSCLLQVYRDKITNARSTNCKVFTVESSDTKKHSLNEHGIDKNHLTDIQMLPHLIANLQKNHVDKIIHIIIEECQMLLTKVDEIVFEKEWNDLVDERNLGNVWIIQSSFITGTDSAGSLPGFQMVHLDRIMRMSKQNVDFVNIFLGKQYKLGHGITGNRPVIYRMKCICHNPSDSPYQCFVCHVIRIVWMLHKAIIELGLLRKDLFEDKLCLKDAILLSLQDQNIATSMLTFDNPFIPFSINAYPEEGSNRLIISSVRHFTGCEHSIVFVDLNSAFYDRCYEIECLTRTLGQLVMLDGGCYNEKVQNYNDKIMKLQDANKTGDVEIREIVPSTGDMITLKKQLIDYLEHEKERLKVKIEVALTDGFFDRVDKAKKQIDNLEKQQNNLQVWLFQKIIKKLHV